MQNRQIALIAAKEASRILLKNYNNVSKITQKSKNNFVTNVDFAVETAIINIIAKYTNHSILSEETGFIDNNSDYRWIIDPLDGTHNYIHGFPIFGTSIALEYKREIILGVISLPLLNKTVVAEKGKGAYLNGKRIRVSDVSKLDKSLMVLDSALHKNRALKIRLLKLISSKVFRVRLSGCAVFDLTSVAEGNADEYILFQTNPWDVAAGFLMVEEAGGRITDFKGNKADHYTLTFVASNGRVHNSLLKILKKIKI